MSLGLKDTALQHVQDLVTQFTEWLQVGLVMSSHNCCAV